MSKYVRVSIYAEVEVEVADGAADGAFVTAAFTRWWGKFGCTGRMIKLLRGTSTCRLAGPKT